MICFIHYICGMLYNFNTYIYIILVAFCIKKCLVPYVENIITLNANMIKYAKKEKQETVGFWMLIEGSANREQYRTEGTQTESTAATTVVQICCSGRSTQIILLS